MGAKPAKDPQATTGKIGGNLHSAPPDKIDNTNCPHSVLVKHVKAGEEVSYRCMKCGQPFKKPDELPKTQFAGGIK